MIWPSAEAAAQKRVLRYFVDSQIADLQNVEIRIVDIKMQTYVIA
jgi:hypothetical protein